MSRDFYEVGDIAERLDRTRERVYQMLASGELPGLRRGRRWVIPVRAWEAWLAQQAEQAAAEQRRRQEAELV